MPVSKLLKKYMELNAIDFNPGNIYLQYQEQLEEAL
jgi:hypothetical protein